MAGTLDPDLYFVVDELCPSCPIYIFDKFKQSWKPATTKPVVGDHVVIDFTTEKVAKEDPKKKGLIVYRTINPTYDKAMWNGSIPDRMPIFDPRVSEAHSVEFFDDPDKVAVASRRTTSGLRVRSA